MTWYTDSYWFWYTRSHKLFHMRTVWGVIIGAVAMCGTAGYQIRPGRSTENAIIVTFLTVTVNSA